jgi:acetyltransferase-like isoleucine patch superfamily enzyme
MLKLLKSSGISGGSLMKKFPDVEELVVGKNVKIEENVSMKGKKIVIGEGTIIRRGTTIDVSEYLEIDKKSIIGENNRIMGRDIRTGREFYSNHSAEIGGGSCFEKTSRLTTGYWFHLGSYSIINTAMGVKIGDEVGMGRFTNIYTHGAYLSVLNGFPVTFGPINIGNNVWMPGATVNPNVDIGDNVVVGVGSLVLKDLPSGCLAAGVPCRIIKENCFPQELSLEQKRKILEQINNLWDLEMECERDGVYKVDDARIDFEKMWFTGNSSKKSERARNILRRHGIRFKVDIIDGEYREWSLY